MPILYEYLRRGAPTGHVVAVDEAADLHGDDDATRLARRHAVALIQRMDGSTKWRRWGGDTKAPQPAPEQTPAPAGPVPVEPAVKGPDMPTQADVRAWAKAQGLEVSDLGRVPQALIEQYLKAHEG